MTRSRLAALSLVLVALTHGALTGRWIGSGVTVAALVASLAIASRAGLAGFAQRLVTLLAAAAGGAVGWLETPVFLPPLALGRGWSAVAVAALFAGALRTWTRAPEGGFFATFLFGLAAMVACGEAPSGAVFPVLAMAYLALSLTALRAQDDARVALSALPARVWLVTGVQLALVAATTAAFARYLPPAASWSRDRLILSLGDPTTGLGDRMVLGSLEGMLQSNEIVARVHGPHTDYLRGVVYNQYQAGQWAASATEGARAVRADPAAKAAVRVVFSGASRQSRYLLPLGASAVSAAEAAVTVDRFGALRPERGLPTEVRFDIEGAPDFPPAEPTPDDLRMPAKLARAMSPLLHEWIQGAGTPEEKVQAIAGHLRSDFVYSLEYKRGPGDPLLDFLGENRLGHCEYFASAMAMLARAAGVPARVVAGYRVAEHNDLGDYDVVREKNAHAWVEVYFAGKGWQTVDATPEDLLPQNQAHPTSRFAALWDVAGTLLSRAMDRLAELTITEIVSALLAVILVGLAVRMWGRRSSRAAATAEAFWRTDAPPPALTRLLAALAAAGQRRAEAEPLERFAARLAAEDKPEAAALLSRYSALRYGDVGDGESLFREMETFAAGLRHTG